MCLHHLSHSPPSPDKFSNNIFLRILDNLHPRINPTRQARPPVMRPDIRQFLNRYLAWENRGLGELIGKKVDGRWYWD
jgi:hypothetical protein